MIPFTVTLQPGVPLHEQVAFAARKAIVSKQMLPGQPFPSVRALSTALKINPNTAHKVIAALTAEGLLEVHPGKGTLVTEGRSASRTQRAEWLHRELEMLTVEAKQLGLTLAEVQSALAAHWLRLERHAAKGRTS
jgi:GntR family transcriptional regulator